MQKNARLGRHPWASGPAEVDNRLCLWFPKRAVYAPRGIPR